MSQNKEETLASLMEKASSRLKSATGYMVMAGEPMHVMQTLSWQVHMLRAEMTALRDMMNAKGVVDTVEYQKRTKDHVEAYTGMIERAVGIQVHDGGIITITDRADKGRGKSDIGGIIKPS